MIDRKTVLAGSGLGLVLVLIFALLRAPAPATNTKHLTLGTVPAELSGLIWLAEDQGFFSDAGLDLEVNLYETGAQAIGAMQANELDLATCAEYVAVLQMLRRHEIRILAVIGSAEGFTEVLTIRDRGLVEPADLRGKKIGSRSAHTSLPGTVPRFAWAPVIGCDDRERATLGTTEGPAGTAGRRSGRV